MTGLAFLLFAAAAGHVLARWLRLPLIPVLLVTGKLLALAGLSAPPEISRQILELGLIFLVFTAGIELHPGRFQGQHRFVGLLALVQFAGAGVAGFGVARLLGLEPVAALYVGGALATSSTLMAVRHLRRQEAVTEPLGRLVIGALLVQDFLIVGVLVALAGLPEGVAGMSGNLLKITLLLAVAWMARRWLLPWLIVGRQLDEESLLLVVLATLAGFSGLAFLFGLPMAGGAFLAGLALSQFPLNGLARGQLSSLSDFFLALLFIVLADIVVVPGLEMLLQALALVAVIVVATPVVVTVLAERTGLCTRAAIESGLVLAQASEFALILGLAGLKLAHIGDEVFSLIALVTVLTMMINPFLAREKVVQRLLAWHPGRLGMKTLSGHRGHVLMLGFGAAGMWVVKPLRAAGHDVLVVDDDPAVIAQLRKMNIDCLRGDAADPKVLGRAGAADAKLVLVATRRVRDAEAVLRQLRDVPVIVRVFEQADSDRISSLGGIPVLNSAAAADAFMTWFGERDRGPEREAKDGRLETGNGKPET